MLVRCQMLPARIEPLMPVASLKGGRPSMEHRRVVAVWRYAGKLPGDRDRANTTERGGTAMPTSSEPRACAPSSTTTPALLMSRYARRASPYSHRSGPRSRQLVCRSRRGHRARPLKQQLCLPFLRLARHLRRARHPPKRTRPYLPQANGKIELFHRTLANG